MKRLIWTIPAFALALSAEHMVSDMFSKCMWMGFASLYFVKLLLLEEQGG